MLALAADGRAGRGEEGEGQRRQRGWQSDRASPRAAATGVAAIAAKDYVGAADSLAQAYRVSPDAETLYQRTPGLGQRRTVFAQDLMRRFPADPGSANDPAAKRCRGISEQPRPPSGEVAIVGERGALVLVDERVAGMLPLPPPLLLASGEHRITLEMGQRRIEGPVKVLPGRLSELRFNVNSDAVVSRVVPAVVWLPEFRACLPKPSAS